MVIKKNNIGDRPNDFVTAAGEEEKIVYSADLQKDGNIILVPSGKRNIYAEIQSYKNEVDINMIIERFKNGDIDVLNRVQGVYADITSAPKTIFDAMKKVNTAKQIFEQLPAETKTKFNNSFENWIISAGENEWLSKMSFVDTAKESEVNQSNES